MLFHGPLSSPTPLSLLSVILSSFSCLSSASSFRRRFYAVYFADIFLSLMPAIRLPASAMFGFDIIERGRRSADAVIFADFAATLATRAPRQTRIAWR
jgi:hypothetical protein